MIGLLIAAALATPSTVPTSRWPAYQFTSDHNAVFDSPDWNVSWKADIGGKNNGGLAVVGDTVYVESFAKKVFAFDAATGAKRWEQSFDDIVMTTPLVSEKLVYVSSGVGAVLSDDGTHSVFGRPEGNAVFAVEKSDGRIAWRFKTIGQNMPTGVLASVGNVDALVFDNGDERLRALAASNGRLLWEKATPGNVTMSSLALYEGAIFGISFGSNAATWDALQKNDTRRLALRQWMWATRPASGDFLWKSPYGGGDCSPTVADGIVFSENEQFDKVVWTSGPALWPAGPTTYPDFRTTTLRSEVDAVDARTGSFLWKYVSSPGVATGAGSNIEAIPGLYVAGTLYQAMPYPSEYAAFDGRTGRMIWKISTKAPVKMGAVLKDGLLYFGDNGGNFYVIRAIDGTIVQTMKFADPFGCSPPVIVGHTLFVTDGNTLYALRLAGLSRGSMSS